MAEEILMPRQGNTVESCIILEWRKSEGDSVSPGDVICEVETDKATFEVEATAAGSLLKVFFEEGDDVPVLTPIAVIGETGEDISKFSPAESGATKPETSAAVSPGPPAQSTAGPMSETTATPEGGEGGKQAISPRARSLAEGKGVALGALAGKGTGPGGRIIERDVVALLESGQPLTPAAAAVAASGGVTVPAAGTGIGGRVTVADLSKGEPAAIAGHAPAAVADLAYPGETREYEIKGVRKIVSEKMHASLQSTAQLTMHASADARAIMSYRAKLKASQEELGLRGITINDLVLYAAVQTLRRYPALNAHFLGDRVVEFSSVHAAFAVDTERGLMVPVIRFADRLNLRALAAETKRLSTQCIEGGVKPDDLTGGTITVTNLGALGIEMFTPILNPPQTAILGVCTIQPKAVLEAGETVFRPHIGLSLTIDHQAVDGSPAAHFLKDLCGMIDGFELTLAG